MNVFGSKDKETTEKLSNKSGSLNHTGFLVPPQEEKSVRDSNKNFDGSFLAPPQEEKVDVAGARGERSRIDEALDRMVDKINKHEVVYDAPKNSDEVAEELVNRGAALAGGAGITGEDFGGVSDRQRLVRRNT
ncbi:hypothetical protein BD311DRAFT_794999 [Dichomitus squalens]|uniref:Uncharacterized protein n=1 Tax=Dichomitus squalens TaxID=114155 RepID=A0A4Q9MYF8_9APHY|nr:hypothetical protein BD311DRAFT_794999 [Dichomitus squalens]